MGILKFKNKGKKEIYLTRSYNSVPAFTQYKDDAHFNDDQNPFSDYCFQVTCGNWQNDKIKITSLPNKGKLFYQTNPALSNPVYAPVEIGQIILVRDLIDYRVLQFNAEGSYNSQFTGNYLTEFKIERFCGTESNGIIATVKLNMIDVNIAVGGKYPLYIPQNCTNTGDSPTNYDVYCQGTLDFQFSQILNTSVGFVKMTTDGGTSDLGISKQNGGALILFESLPVLTAITASLSAQGINSPSAYPFGYPSQPVAATYVFQYSLNGFDNWTYFYLQLYAG